MGVDMSDVDSSGRPSLLVTNFQDEYHALYLNLGKERFLHSTRSFGIGRIGQRYVGFGTGFADFDRDGWEDFVIANGHVLRHPINTESKQRPVLMRNEADGERRIFRAITEQGGDYFRESHLGRGLAVGDLDNDGWPDLVISHQNEPITFLRNVVADFEKDTHWLGVKLVGRDHRDVTGSRVELEIGGRKLVRFVKSGGSYLSSGDSRLLFGLGKESGPGKLTIVWSGGERQIVPVPEMDRYLSVQEIGK